MDNLSIGSVVALFYMCLFLSILCERKCPIISSYLQIFHSSDSSLFLHLSQTSFTLISRYLYFYQGLIRHYRPELLERIEQFKQKQQKKATA